MKPLPLKYLLRPASKGWRRISQLHQGRTTCLLGLDTVGRITCYCLHVLHDTALPLVFPVVSTTVHASGTSSQFGLPAVPGHMMNVMLRLSFLDSGAMANVPDASREKAMSAGTAVKCSPYASWGGGGRGRWGKAQSRCTESQVALSTRLVT